MKKIVSTETEDRHSSRETESIVDNTTNRMSNHETDTSSSNSFTSNGADRQNKDVTDTSTQQLKRLCELKLELKEEQFGRDHAKLTVAVYPRSLRA